MLPLIMPKIVGWGAIIPQSMTAIAYALKSCVCFFSLHTFVRVKNNMHLFFCKCKHTHTHAHASDNNKSGLNYVQCIYLGTYSCTQLTPTAPRLQYCCSWLCKWKSMYAIYTNNFTSSTTTTTTMENVTRFCCTLKLPPVLLSAWVCVCVCVSVCVYVSRRLV